jgi:hypothetical protein
MRKVIELLQEFWRFCWAFLLFVLTAFTVVGAYSLIWFLGITRDTLTDTIFKSKE